MVEKDNHVVDVDVNVNNDHVVTIIDGFLAISSETPDVDAKEAADRDVNYVKQVSTQRAEP